MVLLLKQGINNLTTSTLQAEAWKASFLLAILGGLASLLWCRRVAASSLKGAAAVCVCTQFFESLERAFHEIRRAQLQ